MRFEKREGGKEGKKTEGETKREETSVCRVMFAEVKDNVVVALRKYSVNNAYYWVTGGLKMDLYQEGKRKMQYKLDMAGGWEEP